MKIPVDNHLILVVDFDVQSEKGAELSFGMYEIYSITFSIISSINKLSYSAPNTNFDFQLCV